MIVYGLLFACLVFNTEIFAAKNECPKMPFSGKNIKQSYLIDTSKLFGCPDGLRIKFENNQVVRINHSSSLNGCDFYVPVSDGGRKIKLGGYRKITTSDEYAGLGGMQDKIQDCTGKTVATIYSCATMPFTESDIFLKCAEHENKCVFISEGKGENRKEVATICEDLKGVANTLTNAIAGISNYTIWQKKAKTNEPKEVGKFTKVFGQDKFQVDINGANLNPLVLPMLVHLRPTASRIRIEKQFNKNRAGKIYRGPPREVKSEPQSNTKK